MTIKDVERIESILSDAGLDYQLELEQGSIIVIGPSDIVASEVSLQFASQRLNWVKTRRLGRVFDSAGGLILPNSDLKAPDVSFVSRSRLPRSVRYFATLVPDLVVEVKSQSEKPFGHSFAYRLKKLREKIKVYLDQGVQIAILIDPDTCLVEVYRPDAWVQTLGNGDI
ncbi:MAG: Uma2 family endonuclease [Chroococcales cyanobacterium]